MAMAESSPLFVIDPHLWEPAGACSPGVPRGLSGPSRCRHRASIASSCMETPSISSPTLRAPRARTPSTSLRTTAPTGPARDTAVQNALEAIDVRLVRTGSSYAVAAGRVTKQDGTAYRVFTPFYRAWLSHGWRATGQPNHPATSTGGCPWNARGTRRSQSTGIDLPEAGEEAAWKRWANFHAAGLSTYDEGRNRPDLDGTSAMSHHLKYGEIHPRSILAELTDADDGFRREICWREF